MAKAVHTDATSHPRAPRSNGNIIFQHALRNTLVTVMVVTRASRAVGVDVSVRRGLDVVLLEGRRFADGPWSRVPPSELASLLSELNPDVVAIDSPPAWSVPPARARASEHGLARLGLRAFATPSDPAAAEHPFYRWMVEGFAAFAAAAAAGFELYLGGRNVRGTALEVFPHGSAVALRGLRPPRSVSRSVAQRRVWRTEALALAGVVDARLRTLDLVDAALAAVTGVMALEGDAFTVGDETAVVVLPGSRPERTYPPGD
jgi:hypothetical protein